MTERRVGGETGLKAASYVSDKFNREFAFAGRIKGKAEPVACRYDLPKPQRDHFSFLTQGAAAMMVTAASPTANASRPPNST